MGLLSSQSATAQKAKYARLLIKGNTLICLVLYFAGLVYFWMLAHKDFNHAAYFSENALLPGLVYSEIKADSVNYALQLQQELEHEREHNNHKSTTPHAWILAKMRQIGLDTFVHNFTLNYPLGGGKVFTGKNVYGILRAPRVGSTESFVLCAPYRPPDSVHPAIMHSVPLLLAFASHARKQKYWAKDLIFLITEKDQLGMQAWLEAYKGTQTDVPIEERILDAGTLDGRAGSIQAAINLELQSFDTEYLDIKIEGLNGQLPNLDLVNLVHRIAIKEGLAAGHQQTSRKRNTGARRSQAENFAHMLTMVLTQASGVPNGNHGLFHRYGIEALTVDGRRTDATNSQRKSTGVSALLKLIESVSRSINNLLERFHQSFFFYVLVSSDRFVSIGDYMPCLALVAGALLIKALIVWLTVGGGKVEEINAVVTANDPTPAVYSTPFFSKPLDYNFIGVVQVLFIVHAIGLLASYLPYSRILNDYAHARGFKTEQFIGAILVSINLGTLVVPRLVELSFRSIQILHIAVLLELGTALIVIGMLNFAFAFTLAVAITPFVILINPNEATQTKKHLFGVARILCALLNPLLVTFLVVVAVTAYNFPELAAMALVRRSFVAALEAITFAVVDSMIYGNWIFNVVVSVFLPIWMALWTVAVAVPKSTTPMTNQEDD